MRDYAIVAPQFWTGDTGLRLLAAGTDAQLVALYLITCPSSNMIGLYNLSLGTLCDETGLKREGALKALRRGSEAGFAYYDEASKTVWVPEMARFQVGESLKPNDHRSKWVSKEASKYRKSRFYVEFMNKYGDAFNLETASPLTSPFEGGSDKSSPPLRSQDQEQDQEQKQEQEQKKTRVAAFVKPTIEEVRQYCQERRNNVDPQTFFDFYESKGWRVGREAMKNWQACVRTWEKRNGSNKGISEDDKRASEERFRDRYGSAANQ